MEALSANRQLTWQTAYWASGPKVAEWIDSQRFLIDHKGTMARKISYWRNGTQANFYAIDRLLSYYCHHVSELPDDVWEPAAPIVHHTFTPKPCKRCGKEIPRPIKHGKPEPPSRYKGRVYCSEECRAQQTEERTCTRCGKSFVFTLNHDTPGRRTGVFCSLDCMREAGRDVGRAKRKANWKPDVGRQAA